MITSKRFLSLLIFLTIHLINSHFINVRIKWEENDVTTFGLLYLIINPLLLKKKKKLPLNFLKRGKTVGMEGSMNSKNTVNYLVGIILTRRYR